MNANGGTEQLPPSCSGFDVWEMTVNKAVALSADGSHARSAQPFLLLHGTGSCGVVGVVYTEPTWHSDEMSAGCAHSCIQYFFFIFVLLTSGASSLWFFPVSNMQASCCVGLNNA